MGSGEVRWGGEEVNERPGGERDRGDGERSQKSLPSSGDRRSRWGRRTTVREVREEGRGSCKGCWKGASGARSG